MPGKITLAPGFLGQQIAGGGTCQKLSLSGTSVQSAAITASVVHITPTVDCFVRDGSNPTALNNGTDEFLLANATQAKTIKAGDKLAFITDGATGTVYIAGVVK